MRKRISVEKISVGMYIHELCGSWMEHPFWLTSFRLGDPKDIERIVDSGIKHVWIDTDKGLDAEDAEEAATEEDGQACVDRTLGDVVPRDKPDQPVSLQEELRRAREIVSLSRDAVASMFHEVRMGATLRAEDAYRLVDEIGASVARHPDALISIVRLKQADDYTYMHSVAVCGLMTAMAIQLGLDGAQRQAAGIAGLLHDVGKAVIPAQVLNKPASLTDEEFALVKSHPGKGYELLRQSRGLGDVPLDVCLHHHEKMDGSGYPHQLAGGDISIYARMAAVCDVYDAITSDRPYKQGWDPAFSVRKMAEWCAGHFDEEVFRAFVRCVGIYPIGSLVQLESGRLAVVAEKSPKSLLKPQVIAFYSTNSHMHLNPQRIDLAAPGATDKIAAPGDPRKWNGCKLHVPPIPGVTARAA